MPREKAAVGSDTATVFLFLFMETSEFFAFYNPIPTDGLTAQDIRGYHEEAKEVTKLPIASFGIYSFRLGNNSFIQFYSFVIHQFFSFSLLF